MLKLVVARNGAFWTDLPTTQTGEMVVDAANTVWLDVQDPTEADVALLRDEFGFHPLAVEDATRAHERPKVDAFDAAVAAGTQLVELTDQPRALDPSGLELQGAELVAPIPAPGSPCGDYYLVIFYAATYSTEHDHILSHPISLFIGANYLVTVHPGPLSCVQETLARWQAPGSPLGSRVSALVHTLLDAIVDDYFPLMDRLADRIEDLEDTIFIHYDEAAIQTIFGLKKDMLNLRRIVAPERDVLNVLLRRQLPIFRADDIAYLQDVYDHIVRVTDNIDTYRDLLSNALDSYLSLQSNNLNQIMKLLTIASIILMTGGLIAGIYGMNFRHMPELEWGIGHGWALIVMAAATVVLVIYFRRKRWL